MTLRNINTKKNRGFTIVELLIVIVVIAILAAITLVAYNGVTARAKTAASQSAAQQVQTKAEAYNADPSTTGYPTTWGTSLIAGAAGMDYQVTGVTLIPTTPANTTAPSSPGSVLFYTCTAANGNIIGYWNYSTNAINWVSTGSVTAPGPGTTVTSGCTQVTSPTA